MTGLFGRRNFRKFTIPVTRSYHEYCSQSYCAHSAHAALVDTVSVRDWDCVCLGSASPRRRTITAARACRLKQGTAGPHGAWSNMGTPCFLTRKGAKLEHGVTGRINFSQICRGGARNKDERNERNILTLGRKSTFAPTRGHPTARFLNHLAARKGALPPPP